MTDRETNLRSVLFLVIGILLLLSLVICILIVGGESDLVEVAAEVSSVSSEPDSSGKYEVQLIYEVDSVSYQYVYTTKETVSRGEKVKIFYHSKNKTSVQSFKTSKLIFICPIIGLIICIVGLVELFRKGSNDSKGDYKTSVIGVVGDTRQLKIITDDTPIQQYEKSPEEIAEAQVKLIKKEIENIKPVEPIVAPVPQSVPQAQPVQPAPQPAPVQQVVQPQPQVVPQKVAPVVETPKVEIKKELAVPKAAVVQKPVAPQAPAMKEQPVQAPVQQKEVEVPKQVEQPALQPQVQPAPQQMQTASRGSVNQNEMVSKIQEAAKNNPSLGEDDIKSMIKDVLKEVISEVQAPQEPPKEVVQKRVLPNYFYISGTSLIYEELGKEAKEISLKTIKSVVRTINSEGNVVKLVVSNDEIKCILTNMKNIDLEQVANLLHNKMSTIDENFTEEIEHKEY